MMVKKNLLFCILVFVLLLSGCSTAAILPTPTETIPTATPPPPTPTSLPMAIRVNGEGILLTDYEEEFKRFEDASIVVGKTFSPEEIKTRVVNDLAGSLLLEAEARKNGFILSDTDIDNRINQLKEDSGGEEAFNNWLQSNHFTLESFRRSLIRSLGVSWQRDRLMSTIGESADQIHARQILFTLEASANNYRQMVDNGSDFAGLASEADPTTKGELGWFPRGYLLQKEVEDAAFELQVGQVSQVIKSSIGFHLVQVIERDQNRKLSANARSILQSKVVKDWVDQAMSGANIEILVP